MFISKKKILFFRNPVNFLLLNLAVADMMFALFIGQRFVLVHLYPHPVGLSGSLLCKSHNLTWVGGAASVFTLVAIAFERFYAVIYPYGNKGKVTYGKLKVCWVIIPENAGSEFLFVLKILVGFCHITAILIMVKTRFPWNLKRRSHIDVMEKKKIQDILFAKWFVD